MELTRKRVAVLAEDRYQTLELWYPVIRLREAGATVVVVGRQKGKVHVSGHGTEVTADISAAEALTMVWDAVIIPGGYAPDLMRRIPAMIALVREAHKSGTVVAAICHAGWMLASAGLARGRKLTSFHSIKDDMVNSGAIWVDEPVVSDGRVITSRQPEDLPFFCREIIANLASK